MKENIHYEVVLKKMVEDMETLDIKIKILIHIQLVMEIIKFQEVIILPEHMKFQEDIEKLVMEENLMELIQEKILMDKNILLENIPSLEKMKLEINLMEKLILEDMVVQLQEALKDITNKLIKEMSVQLKHHIQKKIIEIYKEDYMDVIKMEYLKEDLVEDMLMGKLILEK